MLSEAFAYQSLEPVALYRTLVHLKRHRHSQPGMVQLIESGQNLETGVGNNTGLFKDFAKGALLGQAILVREAHSEGGAWAEVLPALTRQTTSSMNTGPGCWPGFDRSDLVMPKLAPNRLAIYWPERKRWAQALKQRNIFKHSDACGLWRDVLPEWRGQRE